MQIDFGRTWREKFGYLIISGIFMLFSAMLFKITILATGTVDATFFTQYEMFYNIIGALIGFVISQVFIRMHIKAARRGGF
jgi:uncharacterized membrane protein